MIALRRIITFNAADTPAPLKAHRSIFRTIQSPVRRHTSLRSSTTLCSTTKRKEKKDASSPCFNFFGRCFPYKPFITRQGTDKNPIQGSRLPPAFKRPALALLVIFKSLTGKIHLFQDRCVYALSAHIAHTLRWRFMIKNE